jgi:hypothetical protein
MKLRLENALRIILRCQSLEELEVLLAITPQRILRLGRIVEIDIGVITSNRPREVIQLTHKCLSNPVKQRRIVDVIPGKPKEVHYY